MRDGHESIVDDIVQHFDAPVICADISQMDQVDLDHVSAIVVMGGDGSVGKVLGTVAQRNVQNKKRIPVGIIPAGTGNIVARCLGLVPSFGAGHIRYCLDVIKSNNIASIDVGMANGTPFSLSLGVGPLAYAVAKVTESDKQDLGILSYLKPLCESLYEHPYEFKLTIEDKVYDVVASGLFVCIPPDIGIGQRANLEGLSNGLLHICIMNPQNLEGFVKAAARYSAWFLAGADISDSPYHVIDAKSVRIEAVATELDPPLKRILPGADVLDYSRAGDDKLPMMLDGDPFGTTPCEVSILPHSVDVFVPVAK